MKIRLLVILALITISSHVQAEGIPVLNVVNAGSQGTSYSVTMELLALMSMLTLLPSLLLMMTPFIRIIIVMSLLRQALGTGQTPPIRYW